VGLSVVYDECQDSPNAVKYIRAALSQDPCAPPFLNSYRIIRGRTILAFNTMDVNDAAVPMFFKLLVDLDTLDAAACLKFSQHAVAKGDGVKALALTEDAKHLEPPTAERLRHLAGLLTAAGRYDEARAREAEANALAAMLQCPVATA
jgi:tetratricopeptide (TPR) repeat protein